MNFQGQLLEKTCGFHNKTDKTPMPNWNGKLQAEKSLKFVQKSDLGGSSVSFGKGLGPPGASFGRSWEPPGRFEGIANQVFSSVGPR